jgi:hypothetical protein
LKRAVHSRLFDIGRIHQNGQPRSALLRQWRLQKEAGVTLAITMRIDENIRDGFRLGGPAQESEVGRVLSDPPVGS